ncbi:MAG: sialidase family protein [Clostridia bacterium]|jgi:hypothetical protein
MDITAVNPTKREYSKAYGGLEIVRMAPGDQRVTLDYVFQDNKDGSDIRFNLSLRERMSGHVISTLQMEGQARSVCIEDLRNGVDYMVEITACSQRDGREIARSPVRFFRTGFVPGTVINYIHPDDYTYEPSGRSPASPSLVRLPGGELLASHDIYWGEEAQNLSKVFISRDEGKSWSYLSDVYPCFWGKLFVHRGVLYMLGTSTEYGALLLFSSKDGGESWSSPIEILSGGSREKGGPHKAPMPILESYGRLWTAIDYGSWSIGGHASGVASVPVDVDLMDPMNWTVSPFLPYDSRWPGTIQGGSPGLLEGNVVMTPEGDLVNFLRYHTIHGSPDYGKAIYLYIDKDKPSAPLRFGKVVDFPGSMSKFTIRFDPESRKYYALVNRVTTANVSQRNILTLIASPDLENWEIRRDLINFQDIGWPEDDTKVGFQYVDWMFDGEDILAVSRTAINNAFNFHNANHLTFHRFRNFRR